MLLALLLASPEAALDGLGDRDALRKGEADRCVDADALVGRLLDRRDPSPGHRDLHDHVRAQPVEPERLLEDCIAVAEETGIRLDGEAPVASAMRLEDRFEEPCGPDRQLLDELPGDGVLGGGGKLAEQAVGSRPPRGDVALEHRHGDHRIARRADRAVLDGVGELVDRRGVVPEACWRRLRHLVERTPVGDARAGCGHLRVSRRRICECALAYRALSSSFEPVHQPRRG